MDLLAEIKQVVLRINMCSQVSAMRLERATPSTDEDIGGRRPPGGIDRVGDREDGYRQKSAQYFAYKLACCDGRQELLEALLVEAREALEAWQKTPMVAGVDPVKGDPLFPRFLLDQLRAGMDPKELVRRHGVARQYVARLRKDLQTEL